MGGGMLDHLFIGEDGSLYDIRKERWAYGAPLRKVFCKTYREIHNVNEFKATLRAGPYTWPGGYKMGFLTNDGAILCFPCAREEFFNIIWSIKDDASDGWKVIGCQIIEDPDKHETCSHCGKDF